MITGARVEVCVDVFADIRFILLRRKREHQTRCQRGAVFPQEENKRAAEVVNVNWHFDSCLLILADMSGTLPDVLIVLA